MRKPVELIRVPEGQSGRVEQFDEDTNADLVTMYVEGERDQIQIAHRLGTNVMSVRNALRNPRVLAAINVEVKGRATLLKLDALDSAEKDLKLGSEKARISARDFIRTVADGDITLQINQVNSWDPTKDEELWARGEKFFKTHGKMIAAETVREVLESGEDILEGEGDRKPR